MTTQHPSAPVPTITVGDFADGDDLMVWSPHLSPPGWRRERRYARCAPTVVLPGLCSAGAVATGLAWSSGIVEILAVVGGLLALGATAVRGSENADAMITDHRHPQPCRLDRRPGEFYFRSKDFTDLGGPTAVWVESLLAALARMHTSPARVWLDPDLPRQAHVVVWQALCLLHDTRTARQLLGDTDAHDGPAAQVATDVEEIDRVVADIASHLDGCVDVIAAWEHKLTQRAVTDRAEAVLASLRAQRRDGLVAAAEALPQNVWAYITAARDITDAGPFPWEPPPATGPLPRRWRARIRRAPWVRRKSRVTDSSNATPPSTHIPHVNTSADQGGGRAS